MATKLLTRAAMAAALLCAGAATAQDDPFGGGISIPLNYGRLMATMGEHDDSLMGPVFDWLSEEDGIVRIGAGMFPESYQCGDDRDFAAADFNGDYMQEIVYAWNRSDGGVFVGIPIYNLITMEPNEWHPPDPTIDPGVLYATDSLAGILGEIRVATGNFYADSAMEFILAYLAADSTVTLTVFDVDSATLTPMEEGSISDQAVNTEVALMQQKHRINRFDVATGDFDGDGLDEIVLVVSDPAQSPATDIMVDIYDYDTLAQAIIAVSKIPFTANSDPDHTCLRRLAVTAGNFDSDSPSEIAFIHRWADPVDDDYRLGSLHILKLNSEMTVVTDQQAELLSAVPRWPDMGAYIGTGSNVHALTVYDNKSIVGGEFTQAGGIDARRIAAWDGSSWSPLGAGTSAVVRALTVYDGELIAGGDFIRIEDDPQLTVNQIARWDGSAWDSVASGMQYIVRALTVYENKLIAGGDFTQAGGIDAIGIAAWDGSQWQPLATGLSGNVHALTVYNGDLIAGGEFLYADPGGANIYVRRIARWDGTQWHALGEGTSAVVRALTVYNGELIAGGDFIWIESDPQLTVNRIARWDGSSWSPLGAGTSAVVRALTVYDGELIAGGDFIRIESDPQLTVNRIARWDGSAWHAMASGMNGIVRALTVYENKLIAGGDFYEASGIEATGIAAWDGTSWYPLLPSMEMPMDITTGNIDKDGSGGNILTDELIITTCQENAGTAEQHLKVYGFDSTSAVPSICMTYDTTVIASIATVTPSGSLYTSRRTMDVADVTGNGWVDLAMLLSDNSNTTEIEVLELYPDTTVDCTLDSIVAKGSWATESDTISELILADLDTATIELGAPAFYSVDSIIQPLVVLNVPPVHVDYDYVGDSIWDISERYPWPPPPLSPYVTYCAYGNRQDWVTSVQSEVRKDWGISAGLKTHFSTCGATVKAHLNTTYGEGFSVQGEHMTTLSVTQVMEAHAEDMILAASIDYDIWEYPVYRRGERLVGGDVVVVDPSEVRKVWYTGKEIESWIMDHEVENVFSYPRYPDLADNPMVASEGVIQGYTWPMSPSSQGFFALRKEEFESSTVEESNYFGIEVGASIGYAGGLNFFGLGAKWGFEVSVEGTYSRSELNTYTTTFTTADSLHVQYGYINSSGSFEGNRKYEVTPYAYWSRNGSLVLDYAAGPIVNPPGEDPTWWQIHYSDPDPAFILPWRLDPEKDGTEPSENRYKTREIVFIPNNPSPGDTVLILARVHNFSLNPTLVPVQVSFYLGDPDNFGQLLYDENTGDSLFWGCDLDGLPAVIESQGEVAAQMVWQVPYEGNITECQRIWALIDPLDEISPEVHDNDAEITNNKGWNRLDVNTTTDCLDRDGDGWEESAFRCCDALNQWDNCPDVYNPLQTDTDGDGVGDACEAIMCGDANSDFSVNVGDAVFIINYVFKQGPPPEPVCKGDANGDGSPNVGDAVYLINYVFKQGPPPVADCCP